MTHAYQSLGMSGMALLALASGVAAGEPRPLYPPAKAPYLDLVRDGQAMAVVVTPVEPPLEVRHAAGELVNYVRRMSGAELQMATQVPTGTAIVLQVDPALNPVPAGQKCWPGARGYRLRVEGNRLCVTGADALSVLHGAYGLLERHLGVRWLWPGELGEVVPERKTVQVGQLDETSIPHFAVRWVGSGEWAVRHGANCSVRVQEKPVGVKLKWHYHTFHTLVPASKYYEQHPDWWALIKGVRQNPSEKDAGGAGAQLCTSNPQVIAELTRNLIGELDKDPGTDIISFSPNDSPAYCECDACRALDEPGRDGFASHSKRLAVLNNAVAAEVAKSHPNAFLKVGAYAYGGYLRRPLDPTLAPTPNQIIQLCHLFCCHNHPIQSGKCLQTKTFKPSDRFMPNQEFERVVQSWKAATPHLWIYEYYWLYEPNKAGVLLPLVHTLRQDIPFYHEMGAEGFYTQLDSKTFHRYGMNYYLAAKLAWDTSLDVDTLMTDFCTNAFGPAAEPMLAYFRRLEQAMIDANICMSYGLEKPEKWAPKVFTEQAMKDAGALLDQAAATAPQNSAFRQRIAFFRQGFDEAREALDKMRAAK